MSELRNINEPSIAFQLLVSRSHRLLYQLDSSGLTYTTHVPDSNTRPSCGSNNETRVVDQLIKAVGSNIGSLVVWEFWIPTCCVSGRKDLGKSFYVGLLFFWSAAKYAEIVQFLKKKSVLSRDWLKLVRSATDRVDTSSKVCPGSQLDLFVPTTSNSTKQRGWEHRTTIGVNANDGEAPLGLTPGTHWVNQSSTEAFHKQFSQRFSVAQLPDASCNYSAGRLDL